MNNKQVCTVAPLAPYLGLLIDVDAVLVSTSTVSLACEFGTITEVNFETTCLRVDIDPRSSRTANH